MAVPIADATSPVSDLSHAHIAPIRTESQRRTVAIHPDILTWRRPVLGGGAKRVFDLVSATIALVTLAPLLVTIALLIRAQDGGPAIYRQTRIGRLGKPFGCLKFRSMVPDADARLAQHLSRNPDAAAEWRRSRKLVNDPRITPLGAVLRSTSLDELPQFFNILAGEMSLVGPRPVVEEELARYGRDRIYYFSARPGLTGLWQVAGRTNASYAQRVSLDKEYVRRWSIGQDISICLRTVGVVLWRKGAY